ncbi:MAG: hypothetical protein JNL38_07365 [Myxococcales bacterium]|jgi:hypothetical protein|nr:hypothetical protein [Myxococcales bacterium]
MKGRGIAGLVVAWSVALAAGCSAESTPTEPAPRTTDTLHTATSYYGGGCVLYEGADGYQEFYCVTPDTCDELGRDSCQWESIATAHQRGPGQE